MGWSSDEGMPPRASLVHLKLRGLRTGHLLRRPMKEATVQFMRLNIHCGWQSLNVFTHLCGRNGLSNFGRGRACGTMDLLSCFSAFSSSIFRHRLPLVDQQKQIRRMNQPGKQERCVPFVRIHSPLSAFCKSFPSLLSASHKNIFTSEELFHRCQKERAIPCSRK